jgi:6-phosphogluconolactonase
MTDAACIEKRIFEDSEALARKGAEWLCDLAQASEGAFAVCLSGGSTPRCLYERLAAPEIARRFPWRRTHWFWGDERFVPHDHRNSNFRMAFEAFLSCVPVAHDNIHAVPTEPLSLEEAAAAYEKTLKAFYGAEVIAPDRPLFQVTFLGIGEDGHTASLFPGQPALQERRRWAVAAMDEGSKPRITLTYPVLDSSRDIAILATGKRKRDVVARAQAGDSALPVAAVRAARNLYWLTDRAAAGGREI